MRCGRYKCQKWYRMWSPGPGREPVLRRDCGVGGAEARVLHDPKRRGTYRVVVDTEWGKVRIGERFKSVGAAKQAADRAIRNACREAWTSPSKTRRSWYRNLPASAKSD